MRGSITKIHKLFIPLSLIISICLPFSSIAGNIPAGKPTRKLLPVSRDYKILSVKEARLMLGGNNRNTGSGRSELATKKVCWLFAGSLHSNFRVISKVV